MIRSVHRRGFHGDSRFAAVAAALAGAGAAMLWATQAIALKGVGGFKEIGAAVIAPFALWLAWARPLILPYGLYAIVAPLDVLTVISKQDGTIARLLGFAAAAALLLYAVRTRSLRTPPRAIVWLALLCGWMALSTLWSIGNDPGKETLTLLQIAGLYLAVACFPTRSRDMLPLLAVMLLGGLISAVIGIYEFRAAGLHETQMLQDFHRISVTIGTASQDPNMYADGLLLPFAIALTWFARARRLRMALLALAVTAVLVTAIALAGSRDATIGLGIETLILASTLRAWRRVGVPMAAVAVGIFATFPNVIVRAINDSGQGYGRTSIWHVAAAAFLQHPIVGAGAGSFGTVYDRWYLRIYEKYDVGWHMASHDIAVHYGVELGLVGLALVFAWCASQWLLARALPRVGALGDIRAICLASMAALGFAALFIDLFDVKFVWLVFGLIAQARSAAISGET